jgi:hypothetical protein
MTKKNYTKQYVYEDQGVQMSAISIQIPPEKIDAMAEQLSLRCPLTMLEMKMSLTKPYHKPSESGELEPSFDCFGASQRCEAIEEFLEEEIDLDYFKDQGIIVDHFHLHKRTAIEDI